MDGGGDPHGLVRRIFSALAAASDRWPPMDLSPSDANDGSVARGEVGSILIEAAAEGPKIEGRFAMDIDLSYLDSEGTTIDNLAGTIAHEMMHNLGFTHPGGYKDRNYISVFDFIIERNGRYSPGLSLAGDASGRVCYVV